MKKRISKALITLFIFLLPCINVYAETYRTAYIDISGYTNGNSSWNITANRTHSGSGKLWAHEAKTDSKHYHSYCLNMNKTAHAGTCTSLEKKNLTASNTGLSSTKVKILKTLLAHAYYHNGSIVDTSGNEYKKDDKNKILATQILVWEVVEGARTNFDTVAPNKYNESNSAYKKFVSKNSGVKTAYQNIIKSINSKGNVSLSGTVFSESGTKVLTWDGSKYTGKYNIGIGGGVSQTCVASNKNVSVSKSGVYLNVSTTSDLTSDVTITCSYDVGSTVTDFVYYKFTCSGNYQDLIRGEQKETYSNEFKVKTIKRGVKIRKVDDKGEAITGAAFKLTCNNSSQCGSDSYSFDLSSTSEQTLDIKRTGQYILSETKVPTGKQKINDAVITINTASGTATLNSGSNISIQNGNVITINVINTSKYFYIDKRDENNNPIKGATFQIRDTSNNPLKFSWNNARGWFDYNTGGVTDIVNESLSVYVINGMPDGNYKLVEVNAPSPYILDPDESKRTTSFTVKDGDLYLNNTKQTSIIMHNYKTQVIIDKVGNNNTKLPGISFYLYDSTKKNKVKSVLNSAGVYTYTTSEGVESYVTDSNGRIVINSLPLGTYYLEEYDTGETGYPIPEGEEAFTEVKIELTSNGVLVNNSKNPVTISNAKNEFSFYKVDEDGNYLTGGSFKLQKYDEKTKKYTDICLEEVNNASSNLDTYKPSTNCSKYTFTIKNGVATFIDLDSNSTYKVVEIDAPEGYEISNIQSDNELTIKIDSKGYVKSPTTLVNKKIEKDDGARASAELIINIQTGQNVINYILIIGVLLLIIVSLFILRKKINKK